MYMYTIGEEMHGNLETLIVMFLWINSAAIVLLCIFWPTR